MADPTPTPVQQAVTDQVNTVVTQVSQGKNPFASKMMIFNVVILVACLVLTYYADAPELRAVFGVGGVTALINMLLRLVTTQPISVT